MVCVLNEEEFLEEFFEKTLPMVDKLIISEGAVVGNPFADDEGHSLDSSVEIIKRYKEIYKDKIVHLTCKNGKWKDKQLQQNAMLNHVDVGDWIWVFGVDEFYEPDTREKLDHLITKYPYISEFVFSIMHLWDHNNTLVRNGDYRAMRRHQRFFKYTPEMFYTNHPTINDANNYDTFFSDRYTQKKLYLDPPIGDKEPDDSFKIGICKDDEDTKIVIYHYGFCRDKAHQIKKHLYYMMREREKQLTEVISDINEIIGGDANKLYDYIHNPDKFSIGEFDGHHPLEHKTFIDRSVSFEEIENFSKGFSEIAKK